MAGARASNQPTVGSNPTHFPQHVQPFYLYFLLCLPSELLQHLPNGLVQSRFENRVVRSGSGFENRAVCSGSGFFRLTAGLLFPPPLSCYSTYLAV